MIIFPQCKVNLGLQILGRRPDGYHDIETVMMKTGWTDILELLPATDGCDSLSVTGRNVDCPPEKNLVIKALRELRAVTDVPPVSMHLHKIVPDGAGLGGGSADASATLTGLNELFGLGLDAPALADVASRVGADCPFFVYSDPIMLATGTGTTLSPLVIGGLDEYRLIIAKPRVVVPTAAAYRGWDDAHPAGYDTPREPLVDILQLPVTEWQGVLTNDFEAGIIAGWPEIGRVKAAMLELGAVYAAMSGSGAAVFGLFKSLPERKLIERSFEGCDYYCSMNPDGSDIVT